MSSSQLIRVAVAGASGYAGGEVLRLLAAHPFVEIGTLTAHASAGSSLGEVQPHLRGLAHRILEPTTPETLAGHDVVVLGLPHGASGQVAAQLPDDVLVIDLGADHRLESASDWEQFYGSTHAGTWPYGMPELIHAETPGTDLATTDLTAAARQRDKLPGARRIAVPGCNVTAVTLGLQPGVAAGVVEPTDIVAVLANGYSGAGKALKPHLLASEALGSAQPYGVGGTHRHIPEIQQNLRAAGAPEVGISFTPTLVPMARGILATATARLARGADPEQVRAAWEAAYADEPFVHLLPEGQWPSTAMTLGANTAVVQVAVDAAARRVVTVTAIDNLVKGTAGAAVQSMNLALGLRETAGLITEGVAP
ncbi:N-acetyl-gamma-glutamyl-phosphate reductase [Promicromonospora sp. NPDC090134]|uniref:N-acetyl-gamma-glutamyl-phosphate reductase n=1 Tax=Promicromonospora sp. NPDC090134 TaxID=3364408 RepID=UPI00381395C4